MQKKLTDNSHPHLVSLFILMIKEGVDPSLIILGIHQLAQTQQDLFGMHVSVLCFLHFRDFSPIDQEGEGIANFITSLSKEGITSTVLLNALYYACYYCGAIRFANIIDGACQTIK
ncbi:MAG TPA: hypothetical protein VK203_13325 [Nostocaceae cyanobacterium]|nr:hypothetical protein [Nostocaceae cyanobacterium]